MVQIMACGLAGAMPLFESILKYYQLDRLEKKYSEILNEILISSFKKMHLTLSSAK